MKGIATLIKLSKRSLDELRRKMVVLERQKEELLQMSANLKAELVREIELSSQTPMMANFFGDFSKRIQMKREEIALEVQIRDTQIEDLRGKIAEAFSELKKYEIALENFKQREGEKERRKETIQMDEIAEQQFRRKETMEE